jgi:hypothetical protein
MPAPYRPLWWRPWLEAGFTLPDRVDPSGAAAADAPEQLPPSEATGAGDDVRGYLLGASPLPKQPLNAKRTAGPGKTDDASGPPLAEQRRRGGRAGRKSRSS